MNDITKAKRVGRPKEGKGGRVQGIWLYDKHLLKLKTYTKLNHFRSESEAVRHLLDQCMTDKEFMAYQEYLINLDTTGGLE
jgi:hypothetical protein